MCPACLQKNIFCVETIFGIASRRESLLKKEINFSKLTNMEFNYAANEVRRRSVNQNPYLRSHDNNVSRPSRVHNPARYGNILDEMSLPMVDAAAPQTQSSTGYQALRFQTPFASNRVAAIPHISTPRTPYNVPSAMEFAGPMMMPTGSPAVPQQQHYERFPGNNHYPAASTMTGYGSGMDVSLSSLFEQFSEYDEALQMSPVEHQEYNRTVPFAAPQDMMNMSYAQSNPAAYKRFMETYPAPGVQQHFEEPHAVASYNYLNTVQSHDNSNTTVESQVKFSELSIKNEKKTMETAASTGREMVPVSNVTVYLKTRPQKDFPKVKRTEPLRIFSGPIGKMLTWDLLLQDCGQNMLYEVIAPFVAMYRGASECERVLLLREHGMPVVQCFFAQSDRQLPPFKEEQLIRCVGKMMSKNKMRVFSVRSATAKEKACLHRLQFICNRVGNEVAAGLAEII